MSGRAALFFNGDVLTLDPAQPTVEAVAMREGRILAVGPRAACEAALATPQPAEPSTEDLRRTPGGEWIPKTERLFVAPAHERIDLRGAALLPGFIDTHLHPLMLIYYGLNATLRGCRSIAEMQERMRAQAARTAAGAWVVGLDFDEQEWRERRLPTRHDLDAAAPDHPAVLIKHDGHMTVGNTRAIAAAGVGAQTEDPPGGVIDREPDGFPAGPFRENASSILRSALPVPELDEWARGAQLVGQRLASQGVTSIGGIMQTDEYGPAGAPGAFEIPLLSMVRGYLPQDLRGLVFAKDLAAVEAARQSPLHQPGRGGGIGALKLIADGTYGSCTAFMREPFADRPDTRGFLLTDEADLYGHMSWAHQAGLQIAVHVIGDEAASVCLKMLARLLAKYPRPDHRHRFEHASTLSPEIIAEMARLGVVASVSPLFIHSEKGWLHRRLGAARAKWAYPFRAMLDAGLRLAGASDAPVESTDVIHAIACAVTREGFEPQERITPLEAVRMYTLDAAYAQFEEGPKGSLAAGKRADLTVLSENPLRVAPERLSDLRVLKTFIRGQLVFDESSRPAPPAGGKEKSRA
jgi:predicted amidohydrolase YtcJ